jgi:hypothetical protein
MNNTQHHAWRSIGNSIGYVESINKTGTGDKYSYTEKVDKALSMTEKQCRSFCAYMRQCDTVGFWG